VTKSGAKCLAELDTTCPPNAKCNPPAPTDYACPPAVHRYPAALTVHASGECSILAFPEMGHCPRGAICNPPPPQNENVPCPK
jgi:hypothetical protein